MKISIIFINIGSYHLARIHAANSLAQYRDWEFKAIQMTDDTLDHSWGDFTKNSNLEIKTLIPKNSKKYNPKVDAFSRKGANLLKQYLISSSPDVVVIPGWSFILSRVALHYATTRNRVAIVMSESKEDDFSRIFIKEFFKSSIIKKYQSALVGGACHKKYLTNLGMPENAIFTGYDVVDNSVFHPDKIKLLPSPLLKPYFLGISRFITKKNIPLLITAYAHYYQQARENAWDLVLCGDGELRLQIEALIDQFQLQNCVYLPGFLQQKELLPYFAHAQCFIHASTTEQWGLVVNEAMAAGLPVLVSNRCGCFEDLVIEGVNGFGFNPEDQQQLTNLMLKMSSGEVDLEAMGQASLGHIQKYSPDYFAQGLQQAIEYAINQRS